MRGLFRVFLKRRLLTRINELRGTIFLYIFSILIYTKKGIREHLPFKNAALCLHLHLSFLSAWKPQLDWCSGSKPVSTAAVSRSQHRGTTSSSP